jgi:membrane protein
VGSLKQRAAAEAADVRRRHPLVDRLVRMQAHYSVVKGNLEAGAITYFAFLSFFPILALAFAVIGYVARVYPDAQSDLLKAIDDVLPGMVGDDEGQVSLTAIQDAAPGILSLGLPLMLYSGLGWLSAMRDALLVVFEKSPKEQPNFVVGKLRDLMALAVLGVVLILSVAVSGVVTSMAEPILELLELGPGVTWLLWLVALVLGVAASAVLFLAFFKLLGDPDAPTRSLWSGAVLGALGFEALKQISRVLIGLTKEQPAFQAFGIALILVVWINYFSRVVLYAAAWAHTSPAAREIRERAALESRRMEDLTRVDLHEAPAGKAASGRASSARTFAAGSATALAVAAAFRKRKRDPS